MQKRANRVDSKVLEVMLDLTLAVVDPIGCVNYKKADDGDSDTKLHRADEHSVASDNLSNSETSVNFETYDADDEGQDESHIFPCHITFDDCHPELLYNYHSDHLKNMRSSVQIVKHPKLCEYVVNQMFKGLKEHFDRLDNHLDDDGSIIATRNLRSPTTPSDKDEDSRFQDTNQGEDTPTDIEMNEELSITKYLDSVIVLIKKLTKVCVVEKRNCRIIGNTEILNILLDNTHYLLQVAPERQHIYLEPLIKLAATIADYKITGPQLKKIFEIIKNENADLKVVLRCLERLLNHHFRILRNIKPLKNLNFPTASRTAEEIEFDTYVSNSWHWRLRHKVIEYKKKRSRTLENHNNDLDDASTSKVKQNDSGSTTSKTVSDSKNTHSSSSIVNQITPSWLECSFMTPLSNISPIVHNGDIKFCCSMWASVCGDMLITDSNHRREKRTSFIEDDDSYRLNWRFIEGHWVRLTSRKRLARSCRPDEQRRKPRTRTRRLSAKIRARQAHDKEDEEREEKDEKMRRSEPELTQTFGRFTKLRLKFTNSSSSKLRLNPMPKQHSNMLNKRAWHQLDVDSKRRPPREFLGRRARDNSQELLLHLISFAIDALTIEIWLNVKCMTFCARVCRITSEGRTNLLDQVTFPSHLKADGSWSHLMICLTESNSSSSSHDKTLILKVIVDGVNKEKEKLIYNGPKRPLTNFACLIGCERSTFGYVWKLSQVHIYKNIPEKTLPVYLLGKGPDFWTFTNFKTESTLPLPDVTQRSIKNLLNPKILHRYSSIDEQKALNWLTQNVVIAYVAHQPDYFLDYSPSMTIPSILNPQAADHQFSNSAERFIQAKTLDFTRSLKFSTNNGFGSALVEAGGIESVLIAFADVIRRTQNAPTSHALAFSILLKMSQTNQHHLSKFLDELNGLKLVEFILTHPNCEVSKQMLDCYLDFCLMKKDDHFLIKSPKLIYHLLVSWRVWHKDLRISKQLYRRLIRLLQPPDSASRRLKPEERRLVSIYNEHNFRMLTIAGGIDILMSILRECLVPLDECVSNINHELVEMIVNLISLLIKHPPGLDVMLDTMEFLLFLHPDPKAYVETSYNRTSFLHQVESREDDDDDQVAYDEMIVRPSTPDSRSASLSQVRESEEDMEKLMSGDSNPNSQINLNSADSIYAQNELSGRVSRDNIDGIRQFSSPYDDLSHYQRKPSLISNSQFRTRLDSDKGSTRNYAIANIADMLASIVKLTSTDPMNILSEALQKPIIDARKLIILANNNLALVREKVLRLFLYCIRGCYNLNLRSVLNKYEQDSKAPNFKTCTPIQLMSRQLIKYPTTMKMIQLCYGIIVGIDDFETVETVCLIFDIETINNNLQLNTLILLIQLMTQLQDPLEIESALRFVLAYLKQLLNLGQDETVTVIIKGYLVDSMMRLYFTFVEQEVSRYHNFEQDDQSRVGEETDHGRYSAMRDELDKMLSFIVQHYIQNLPTSETLKSIEDILFYFDLMNSYIPAKHHQLLRDRKARVLLTALRYCKHYETCARRKNCGGMVEYYLRSLFKDNELNTFNNVLPEHLLDLESSDSLGEHEDRTSTSDSISSNSSDERTSGNNRSISNNMTFSDGNNSNGSPVKRYTNHHSGDSDSDQIDFYPHDLQKEEQQKKSSLRFSRKNISEFNVIERFKTFFEFSVNFITNRRAGYIPSPLERRFIIQYVKTLSNYITDCNLLNRKLPNSAKQKSQWNLMLPKLERSFKSNFTKIILYLLSPCDSMNLDERRYYALTLLDLFRVEELINMMDEDVDKGTFKILLAFIKDLIEFNKPAFSSDESTSDQEDEILADDTESKLNLLVASLEFKIGILPVDFMSSNFDYNKKNSHLYHDKMTNTIKDIWLADFKQKREDLNDRLESVKKNGFLFYDSMDDESTKAIDEAVNITKDVVNDKHEQRKAYLEDLKQNKIFNYHIRQQWLSLILGHTHERGIWYLEDHYPKSWELNPVEGPSRIRRRLRPCKLDIDGKFMRRSNNLRSSSQRSESSRERSTSTTKSETELTTDVWCNQYGPHPLCSMIISQEQSIDSNELRIRMFTTDRIHFNCDCSFVRPNEVCDGEVSIASWCIHFIGERNDVYRSSLNESLVLNRNKHQNFSPEIYYPNGRNTNAHLNMKNDDRLGIMNQSDRNRQNPFSTTIVEDLWFDEIVEIWDRRYQLQDVGLEIFLTNNMTYLISFRSNTDREDFKQNLMREQHKMINLQRFNLNTSLNRLTQLWRDGRFTNYDYLTCLNKLAGRSFNDLMQYPIFPFVLSNYNSEFLDLTNEANFRKLKRPMAIQNEEKEANFVNNYQISQTTNLSFGPFGMAKPYHYSNHYSNTATVLHFLVRLPPFTQMLIQYQDNNFDQPDRTFHSIASTWELITKNSNTDFKELIPEFFFLPEMFINLEQFELGRKQNNELVDDVKLPLWCPNSDARLFTLIHRQALESAHVSENLHHWIDLIFGYKQTGKAAVEAINVFHPATYYREIDLSSPNSSTNSSTPVNSTIIATNTTSARSSNYTSDYLLTADVPNSSSAMSESQMSLMKRATDSLYRRQRADIERSALETMIKTYGQMPRQLFVQPMKQRTMNAYNSPIISIINKESDENGTSKRTEPLRNVKGLRWGSYVGSPDEPDIIAVKHKRIVKDEEPTIPKSRRNYRDQYFKKPVERYILHLLPNGEIAIMKSNTSLMLDYRADRKSGGSYFLSLPSTRYSRRAGLSNIARMNLFSNMIISRQQFSFIEIAQSSSSQFDTYNSTSSSLVSITAPRVKFSPDSLSMVSWMYLDGTIRVRHPAVNNQKPSIPLLQANTIVDTMSTCTTVPELNLLLVGYNSGAICAHIVSTSYESAPIAQYVATTTVNTSISPAAAPSAVHFLHTTSGSSSSLSSNASLGPGKISEKSSSGEPYSAVSLAGKTLQSVRSINKTSRWLYCHSKRVNCIKINVSFGIVVTGSDDGTSVIWDLNSLTYVRTIQYRLEAMGKRFKDIHNSQSSSEGSFSNPFVSQQLLDYLCNCSTNYNRLRTRMTQSKSQTPETYQAEENLVRGKRCSICSSGVTIIAISDTLGDVVTVKDINNRLALATDFSDDEPHEMHQNALIDRSRNSSVSNSRESLESDTETSLSSVVYVHTINGSLVGFVNCHTQVTAVCYSHAPEGISVNVIVIGLSDGSVRLYSSWDLSRVKEFRLSGLVSPITSLLYSRDNHLLYITYEDGQLVVLRNKKKGSVSLPKEWFL